MIHKNIKAKLEILKMKNDLETEEGRKNEREKRVILAVLTGGIAKVLAMSLPLITIRLTLNYLGPELYGLWSAFNSFFTIFQFSDLGLGNGLQTKLSQASGSDDDSKKRELVSTTFFMLIGIAIVLLAGFIIVNGFVSWENLVSSKSSDIARLSGSIASIIIIAKIVSIPFSVVQRTQFALQEGYLSNIWQIFSSILSLISIIVISYFQFGKISMIFFSTFIPVFILIINFLTFFYLKNKNLLPVLSSIKRTVMKSMLSVGGQFFFLSLLTTIGLSLDNFIVANIMGLAASATYAILLRIVNMISGVTTMITTPLWAANGEAYARGDWQWIQINTAKASKLMSSLVALVSVFLLIFLRPIISVWLGDTLNYSLFMFAGMCSMQILLAYISPKFMVLNALGKIRVQILLFLIYTPIIFMLKFYFGKMLGTDIVPWVGSIGYLLFIVIPISYFEKKIFKNLEKTKT